MLPLLLLHGPRQQRCIDCNYCATLRYLHLVLLLRHERELQYGDLHLFELGLRADEVRHVALRARDTVLAKSRFITGFRRDLQPEGPHRLLPAVFF